MSYSSSVVWGVLLDAGLCDEWFTLAENYTLQTVCKIFGEQFKTRLYAPIAQLRNAVRLIMYKDHNIAYSQVELLSRALIDPQTSALAPDAHKYIQLLAKLGTYARDIHRDDTIMPFVRALTQVLTMCEAVNMDPRAVRGTPETLQLIRNNRTLFRSIVAMLFFPLTTRQPDAPTLTTLPAMTRGCTLFDALRDQARVTRQRIVDELLNRTARFSTIAPRDRAALHETLERLHDNKFRCGTELPVAFYVTRLTLQPILVHVLRELRQPSLGWSGGCELIRCQIEHLPDCIENPDLHAQWAEELAARPGPARKLLFERLA